MKHLYARQRIDGKWDYTYNGCAWGYCREYKPIDDCRGLLHESQIKEHNDKMEPLRGKFHTDGHATIEEACECYKQYMLDTALRLTPEEPANARQQLRCQICDKFTACNAYIGAYQVFTLCPEHQTRDYVSQIYSVGESWES